MLMTGGEADGMHMMLASSLSVFTISQDWCVVNPSVPYNQIQSCAILRQPNFVEWCETIHSDYFTAEKDWSINILRLPKPHLRDTVSCQAIPKRVCWHKFCNYRTHHQGIFTRRIFNVKADWKSFCFILNTVKVVLDSKVGLARWQKKSYRNTLTHDMHYDVYVC